MNKILVGVVAAIVVVGGFLIFSNKTKNTPTVNVSPTVSATAAPMATNSANTVTLTSSGFEPQTLTVKVGTTVTWIDKSSDPMWIASGVHPIHSLYDGTSFSEHCKAGYSGPTPFDECEGSSNDYSFTFTKKGTFIYHDHLNPSETGTIVVE